MLSLSRAGQGLRVRQMCRIANEPIEYRATKTDKTSNVHSASQQRKDVKAGNPAIFASLHKRSSYENNGSA